MIYLVGSFFPRFILMNNAIDLVLTYEFSTRWKALKLREELGLSGPPADLFLGSRRYYNKVVSEVLSFVSLPLSFVDLMLNCNSERTRENTSHLWRTGEGIRQHLWVNFAFC